MPNRPCAGRAAFVFVSWGLLTGSASAQFDLDTGRGFPAGSDVRALALADVDEDGARDIVVPGGRGLLIHSIRGPFAPVAPPFEWSVAGTVDALAAADFDADGHADIAVASSSLGIASVEILFGNGRGGFVSRTAAALNDTVSSIAVLDADGDGFLDLAISRDATQSVSLVRQNGLAPRAFLAPVDAPVGGTGLHVATGDFNGDGRADVVAASESARTLVLLEGDGAGGFASLRTFVRNQEPLSLDAGDFDGDGLTDVIATHGHLFVYRGDRLLGLVPGWVGPQGLTYQRLAAGDLDGDAVLDLVSGGYVVATWRGDGFGRFDFVIGIESQRYDTALAVGDVDGDGRADVVGARSGSFAVDVLLGDGTGSFVLPELLDGPLNGHGAAVDANADGFLDLVFSGFAGTGSVDFFFGDGQGGLSPRSDARLRRRPFHLLAADLVGSSDVDLLLANRLSASVTLLEGGGGGFVDRGDLAVAAGPVASAAGDFDGDGSPDFATAVASAPLLEVAFGDRARGWARTTFAFGATQAGIASADFDRDGFADAAVSLAAPPGLAVLFGNGSRSFSVVAPTAFGASPAGVAAADLDGDGNLDVVLGDAADRALRVLFGDGVRGFSRVEAISTPFPPLSVSAGDATGDGLLDLLAAHGDARLVSVLPGDGRGFFGAATSFHTWRDATSVFATDLDGDGSPEVVVPGQSGPAQVCRLRETALSASLRGTVGAGRGPARDVLFVNSRSGGPSRTIRLRSSDPVSVLVARPPAAGGPVPFAMYAWAAAPSRSTVRSLPAGLGAIALPMPLVPGAPAPREIWNTIGKTGALGVPTRPSGNAPTTLFRLPSGVGHAGTFTLQGIVLDPGAPNGRAAVTNGIVIAVR